MSGPIPINRISSNAEINYIIDVLHASLKNWNPHINSRMFRISQNPVLLKSKKFLLDANWEEKQQCCQTIKATSPNAIIMNTGI